MKFKINEIVQFEGTRAEVLATRNELGTKASITLLVNDFLAKGIKYDGNFDYMIGVNQKNINNIGNFIFCSEDELEKLEAK